MARNAGAKPPALRASPSPSPPPVVKAPPKQHKSKALVKRRDDYGSDGVQDNDVFLLPVSDYQVMLGLTILAAIVRLFRIYQPTSVVFDEVQYAPLWLLNLRSLSIARANSTCLLQLRWFRVQVH
jgi:dolichyl-phosphate-mannose-protein mannosyltransferase